MKQAATNARSCTIFAISLIALCFSWPSRAQGQEEKQPTPKASREALNYQGTPRLAIETFLTGELDKQIRCLDLTQLGLTEDTRNSRGAELSYELKHAINSILSIDLEAIPNEPEGPPFSLFEQAGLIGLNIVGDQRTVAEEDLKKIKLHLQDDGVWRFSAQTVAAIPDIAKNWKQSQSTGNWALPGAAEEKKPFSLWLRDQFPEKFHGVESPKSQFYIAPYQWFCLLVVMLMGFAADSLSRMILNALTGVWLHLRRHEEPVARKKFGAPLDCSFRGSFGTTE